MRTRRLCIVWIDHTEAKVLHFRGVEESKLVIHSRNSVQRLHQQAAGSAAAAEDGEFFGRIASAIDATRGTVLTGPGTAKFGLLHFLTQHHSGIGARVLEAAPEQDGDAELLAMAHGVFDSADAAR